MRSWWRPTTPPTPAPSAPPAPISPSSRRAAEDGFQPRAAAIEKALTPKTKAILLNTPNNPTGAVYSRAALEGIAELCRRRDLWLLSDEVYWTLGGGEHVSPRALDGMAERTLVINSLSKSHGMTGWRIGWLTGPAEFITLLISLNLVSTYGLNDFVSRAAIAALDNGYGVEKIAALYAGRRTVFLDAMRGMNNIIVRGSEGGMYVMLDIRADRARLREIRLGPARRREGGGDAGLELRRGGGRPHPRQPVPAGRRAEGRRQPHPPLRRDLWEQGRVSNDLPTKARAVIIGGGVSGCSVAYHLAKLGWTDIVLLERKQLTSGTTWHAAGLIGQLRGSQNMTRLAKYSADLYVKLEAETGVATGMRQVGSITRGADRGAQARDLPAGHRWRAPSTSTCARSRRPRSRRCIRISTRRTWSAPCTCRSTASATRPTSPWRWPRARASAARRSSKASRSPRFTRKDGRVTGVSWEKDGEQGTIEADIVVNCAGMWARELGRAERRQHPAARLRAFLSRHRSRSPA